MKPIDYSALKGVQVLRWLAASIVVIAHTDISHFVKNPGALDFFGFGVDIFFSISGFIMMYLIEVRNDGADLFLVRRFARIFPLYLIPTLVVITLCYLLQEGVIPVSVIYHYPPQKIDLDWFLSSIFFVNNDRPPINGIGWTLQFEMAFYFIFSLIIIFRSSRPILACICLYLISALISLSGSKLALMGNPLFLEFLFGMAVYKMWRNEVFSGLAWLFLMPIVIAVGVFLWQSHPLFFGFVTGGYWRVFPAGLSGAAALIFALAIASKYTPKNWMVEGGNYSYSLYLIHWIFMPITCLVMIKYFPNNFILYIVGVTLVSHSLAYIFYKKLDNPLHVVATRFVLKRRQGAN
jgi:exopolysaccharide production protein ExoZ